MEDQRRRTGSAAGLSDEGHLAIPSPDPTFDELTSRMSEIGIISEVELDEVTDRIAAGDKTEDDVLQEWRQEP